MQHMTDLNNAEQLEASGALDEADEAEVAAETAEPVTVSVRHRG